MTPNVASHLPRPKYILFDVYETILDMSGIQQKVNAMLNSSKGYRLWFEMLMQYCFVSNSTRQYESFTEITKATLTLTANLLGIQLAEDKKEEVLWLLKHLSLKPGVQEGLSSLIDEGYELAALTNSPRSTVMDRMERTGLISYFQFVMSAEELKQYKPAVEVYQKAVQKIGLPPTEVLMVSSHSWDLAGAHSANLQTAYIGKPNMFYPLAPKPNYTARDIIELSTQLQLLTA